jgi:hypothetical protein
MQVTTNAPQTARGLMIIIFWEMIIIIVTAVETSNLTARGLLAVDPDMAKILAVVALRKVTLNSV